LLIAVSLTMYWTMIAAQHAAEARGHADGGSDDGDRMVSETLAAMVAVSASAHALDALYGSLSRIVPTPARSNRRSIILETLKQGFGIGAKQHAWLPEFEWLFELRDGAVHHEEGARHTVPHPRLAVHVGEEMAAYSAESAERAYALVVDVLRTCLENPEPITREWLSVRQAAFEQLTSG